MSVILVMYIESSNGHPEVVKKVFSDESIASDWIATQKDPLNYFVEEWTVSDLHELL